MLKFKEVMNKNAEDLTIGESLYVTCVIEGVVIGTYAMVAGIIVAYNYIEAKIEGERLKRNLENFKEKLKIMCKAKKEEEIEE